jgi:transposase
MGRRKVSIEKRNGAIDEVRRGKSPYEVARKLNVSPQAVYSWLSKGKLGKGSVESEVIRRLERVEADLDFLKKDLGFIKTQLGRRKS